MATTTTDLYRSVMGKERGFRIQIGKNPGNDILDPRWESTQYYSNKLGRLVTSNADVTVVQGESEPEVLPEGGTSLHDVSGWFPTPEFWIPTGTEYSDEIFIRKDRDRKTNPKGTVSGFHYQLEPRTRMTVLTFKGYLSNMVRAAVARQCELVEK